MHSQNYCGQQIIPLWQLPLIILLLAVASTLLFWFTDIDIRFTTLFYAPPPAFDPWPQEFNQLWQLSFYSAAFLAAFLAIGAITTLIIAQHNFLWRSYAIYILLNLAIGPGLLINLIMKDHWGRPRPYQIENFGGTSPYLPPLAIGTKSQHKSFPSGHASIGFSLCMFWLLWRKRYPHRAKFALILSIVLGLFMGLGRIATGAHFLSDVLWSGFISFFIAWILYFCILRIPIYETTINDVTPIHNRKSSAIFWYFNLGLIVLSGVLIAWPIHSTIDYYIPTTLSPLPTHWRLNLRYANITIYLHNSQIAPLHITGTIQGFGLPTFKIDSRSHINYNNNALEYLFRQRGFFTELNTNLYISINVSHLKQLTVRVRSGDIQVIADKNIVMPKLDIKTLQGRVR